MSLLDRVGAFRGDRDEDLVKTNQILKDRKVKLHLREVPGPPNRNPYTGEVLLADEE